MKAGKKDRFTLKGDFEVLSVHPLSTTTQAQLLRKSALEEGRCVFNEQETLKGIWGRSESPASQQAFNYGDICWECRGISSQRQLLITFTWPSTRQPQRWDRLLISSCSITLS